MTTKIDKKQVAKVAELLKKLPESGNGMNFYSYMKDGKEIIDSEKFPPLNHPQVINFLVFTVMHDYGFWFGDNNGYLEPIYGTFYGVKSKGSDLLWKMCMRVLRKDEKQFEPAKLAVIQPLELAEIFSDFSDDRGPFPFPDFEARFKMTRAYGRWFIEEKTSPSEIVILANQEDEPLKEFLWWTRKIPGYNRDPFFYKKNLLLAMIFSNRPEKFLKVKDPQNWRPVVNYHLMRLALRLGLIELEKIDQKKNEKREWINMYIEIEIRRAVYVVLCELIEISGQSMSFIDEKIWMGRKYCPEMEKPDCPKCIFTSVCKKRVELFQPIFRTTNY